MATGPAYWPPPARQSRVPRTIAAWQCWWAPTTAITSSPRRATVITRSPATASTHSPRGPAEPGSRSSTAPLCGNTAPTASGGSSHGPGTTRRRTCGARCHLRGHHRPRGCCEPRATCSCRCRPSTMPPGATTGIRSARRSRCDRLTSTADGAVILANVHVGGILRSLDGGDSWLPTMDVDNDVHEVLAHVRPPRHRGGRRRGRPPPQPRRRRHLGHRDRRPHQHLLPRGPTLDDTVYLSNADGPFAKTSHLSTAPIQEGALDTRRRRVARRRAGNDRHPHGRRPQRAPSRSVPEQATCGHGREEPTPGSNSITAAEHHLCRSDLATCQRSTDDGDPPTKPCASASERAARRWCCSRRRAERWRGVAVSESGTYRYCPVVTRSIWRPPCASSPFGHERADEDDALALLPGDLRPVVGVRGVRQVFVLAELLADRVEQVLRWRSPPSPRRSAA